MIKGFETSFHIVPLSFPISEHGILGTPFVKKHNAIVNFETDRLQIGKVDFPFVHHGSICLFVRTKKLVKIQLLDTKLKEGDIRRIQCGPGIFPVNPWFSMMRELPLLFLSILITRK